MAIENIGLASIVLDITTKLKIKTYYANSADTSGRGLAVTVKNAGVVVDCTGVTLRLSYKDAYDQAKYFDFTQVSAPLGTYTLYWPAEMVRDNGGKSIPCTITAFDTNNELAFETIFVYVYAAAVTDADIEASNEYSTLKTALTDVQSVATTVGNLNPTTLADAITLANSIVAVESARVTAESGRVTAESGRVTAENARVLAEQARATFEAYNPLTAYKVGNKVAYLGSTYICTLDTTAGIAPTDGAYWHIMAAKGDSVTYSTMTENEKYALITNATQQWEPDFATKYANLEAEYATDLTEVKSDLAENATLVSKFVQAGDTADSASINRALAYVNGLGGGKVRIPYRTTPYILASPLIIYSNTHLEVDQFATVKLGDGANCRMIENANKTTQTTLTRIDKNIKITGGIWDGNRSMQTKKWDGAPNVSTLMTGFLFSGIDHFEFKPTKIINTVTYGCLICNVNDLLIENVEVNVGIIASPNNCDGIHVLGPAENITIQNCKVKSEDNAISIAADDVGHGPYATLGDITNVVINNIVINNYDGGQGLRLLSSTYALKNVHISDITGIAAYLVVMTTVDLGGRGNYDNIVIENTTLKWYASSWRYVQMRGDMGAVTFRNIEIEADDYLRAGNVANIGIYAESTTLTPTITIDKLTIDRVRMNDVNGLGSSVSVVYIDNNCTVNQLTLREIQTKNNTKTTYMLQLQACSIGRLELRSNDVAYANTTEIYFGASTVTYFSIDNASINSFVPLIVGGTTAGEATYSVQIGKFVKVGKFVTFEVSVAWSGHTGTGQMRCNLPTNVNTASTDYHPINVFATIAVTAGAKLEALIYRAGSRLQFYTLNAGVMTAFNVPASGTIYMSGSYIAQ